ncbi:unnamed protein product [Hydatigera taeniaeformis]|uniref:Uncharacterized protein n=1 Tax=Hydatigena taeniaeformis TaxID=6205 RepID=A0A0R3X763_HYDTA|nr:unnamed protein product [Hydatigera taeniaeformis]
MHALSRSLPGSCKLLRSKRKIRASFVVNHLALQPSRTATLLGVERCSPNINRCRRILTTLRCPRRCRHCRAPGFVWRVNQILAISQFIIRFVLVILAINRELSSK